MARYVVICTVGRSGSTLLQGVLNSQAGFCVRGENANFLVQLYQAFNSLLISKTLCLTDTTPTHPWYGAEKFDEENFIDDAKRAIQKQLFGDIAVSEYRYLGFKEIRWLDNLLGGNNLWSYLAFLERLFPECKFVLLTRKIDEILQSAWWTGTISDNSRMRIETFYLMMRNAPIRHLFEIGYDDLVSNFESIQRLFEFLGEGFDENIVKAILTERHSFKSSDLDLARLDNKNLQVQILSQLDRISHLQLQNKSQLEIMESLIASVVERDARIIQLQQRIDRRSLRNRLRKLMRLVRREKAAR